MYRLSSSLIRCQGARWFSQSPARLLITGSGRDRLGIVRDLSGLVWAGQGNILDSCMTRLAGEFVVMMLAEVPEDTTVDFQFELTKNKNLRDLNISVKHVDASALHFVRKSDCSLKLEVEGADHPGVLHEIADLLTSLDVNIADMTTTFETAPLGGMLLFYLHGYIQLSPNICVDRVRRELAKAGSSLGVKVTLSEI